MTVWCVLCLVVVFLSGFVYPALHVALPGSCPPPPDAGLVGAWNFDEGTGTTAADSSGNGNDGTLVGGPIWTAGKVGTALTFDGFDSVVRLGSAPLISPNQPFTVAYWANLRAFSQTFHIPLTLRTDTNENWRFFWTNYSVDQRFGDVTFGSRSGWTVLCARLSGSVTGQWHHIVVTYNGAGAFTDANFRFYDNGIEQALLPGERSYTNDNGNSQIGMITSQGNIWDWDGQLDEVRIYNRVLSPLEVSQLYSDDGGTCAGDGGTAGDGGESPRDGGRSGDGGGSRGYSVGCGCSLGVAPWLGALGSLAYFVRRRRSS